jgi:hypothetical protein
LRKRKIVEARLERERIAALQLPNVGTSNVPQTVGKMPALVWVEKHPMRAALVGAAAGVAIGLYARQVLTKNELEIE